MSREVAQRREPDFTDPDCRSFKFTPARVDAACRAVAEGEVEVGKDGRVAWRDADTPGLFLRASTSGSAVYILFRKVNGKAVRKVIGPVADVDLHDAREAAGQLRYDRTLAAHLLPRERDTSGPSPQIGAVFNEYIDAAEAGTFKLGRRKNSITDRTAKNYRDVYAATLKAHEHKTLDWLAENVLRLHGEIGLPSGKGKDRKPGRPIQANRMLQTARNVFTYAAAKGLWSKPNPCVDPATGGRSRSLKSIIVIESSTTPRIAGLGDELRKEPELCATCSRSPCSRGGGCRQCAVCGGATSTSAAGCGRCRGSG